MLEECRAAQASVGRKAKRLRLCPEAGQVLVINIGMQQIQFVTADLLGNLRQAASVSLPFRDALDWYPQFQTALLNFFR